MHEESLIPYTLRWPDGVFPLGGDTLELGAFATVRRNWRVCDLGTGSGVSVLQLVHAFEKANDLTIPYKIYDRRAGDIAEFYADASKAEREMGWKATRTIEDMCRDAWNWQRQNPQGY